MQDATPGSWRLAAAQSPAARAPSGSGHYPLAPRLHIREGERNGANAPPPTKMLTLASLLVTAILAPTPATELRSPSAPTSSAAALEPSPCKCAELRDPFPSNEPRPRTAARTIGETDPALRDPFDAPQRTTRVPELRDPLPPRRVRTPGPRPTAPAGELRSPFGRA